MGERKGGKQSAIVRINALFARAASHPELAKRAVQMARRIQTRCKVRMPESLRYRYCKHCGAYWSSKTVRIRTHLGKVVFTCLECKHIRRKPYVK